MLPIQDLRVLATQRLISPAVLKSKLPLTRQAAEVVLAGRAAVENILAGRDHRMLVIVGPCSIHDPEGALDYARRLAVLRTELAGEPGNSHARVLRKAAHDHRLEGTHQRSAHRRHLRHRNRLADRAPPAARHRGAGHPGGNRNPGPHRAAVPRRSGELGRHRRADDREPDAPRNGQRTFDAGRLQERHRRRLPDGHRRHEGRATSPQLCGHRPAGAHQRDQDHGEPVRPRRAARWTAADQLRSAEHRRSRRAD